MSAVAEGTVAPQGGAEDEGKPDTAKGTSTQNGESKAAGSARPNLSTRTTRRVAAEATGDEALSHLPEDVIKEVKALRKRRLAIEDGEDEDFLDAVKDYSSEKRRRISSAQKHYQYQVQYCKALFKHQEKEANDMYDEHAKVIQADMISRINQKIFIQTGVREGHGEADSRVSARKLRSTTKVQDAGDTARKSKYGNGEEAPIDFYLPPDEITLDLKHIASDWRNRSKTYMGTQERFSTVEPKKVRLENGFLFVGDNDRFSASNRVEIYSTYTKEKFFGVITSMNTSELFLRLVDGSKAKVFLKHLRNHRVKISHSEK